VIWVQRKQKFFCKQGWTGNSLICPSGKSADEGSMVEHPSLLPRVGSDLDPAQGNKVRAWLLPIVVR
jgi:hypothetical protein